MNSKDTDIRLSLSMLGNLKTMEILKWEIGTLYRHRENFLAFIRPRRNFGMILLILNMIIHKSFTGPTHFLSANVRGPVSFAVSDCSDDPLRMGDIFQVKGH